MANGAKFSRSDNEIAARLLGRTSIPKIIDPRRIAAPQITVQPIGQWAVKGITPQGPGGTNMLPVVMMAFDVGTPRARADALDIRSAREFAAGIIAACDELEKPRAAEPTTETPSAPQQPGESS